MINIFGGIVSPIDLRDYRLKSLSLINMKFPDSYEVNMRHFIKMQTVNSCTAHTISSILEYFDNNRGVFSTNFIYGLKYKLFNNEGPGETVRDALKIVKDYGDPRYRLCPGDIEVDEVYKVAEEAFNNEECLDNAYRHKIDSYIRLSNNKQIKYSLMKYGPVAVCAKWYNKYNINTYTGWLEFDKHSGYTYHSFIIFGWNELGWLCQNSWGYQWGKNGLFNLSFDYKIKDKFAIIDDKSLDSTIKDVEIIKPGKWSTLSDKLLRAINKILNMFRRRK